MKRCDYIIHCGVAWLVTASFAYPGRACGSFAIHRTGNADGSIVERLDYSSTGDFAGGGPGASAFYHDADDDLDIDLRDFANFQNCFDPTPPVLPACAPVHDFDTTDASDGDIDLTDYARFVGCSNGPFVTPDQACGIPQRAGVTPSSGVFTLHGRPVDILSDGHAILDYRARLYDPVLGRFLQRDPLRYSDGPSLYEAFRSNSLRFSDAFGRQAEEPGMLETLVDFFRRFQSGADPFTGEDLVDKALRRAGAVAEPNPVRRAFLEQVDLYQDVTIATIEAAEPVVARGVGVVQTVGGVAEAGTGVVLVVVSEGLGAAPGTIFVIHGVDVSQAGVRQIISGRFTPTETYSVITEAGYPNAALVVDVGISLSSGISAAGLALEGASLRALPSAARVSPRPSALVAEFPAVSPTGDISLLNIARRGVPLTGEELTLIRTAPLVDPAPTSTAYFNRRILEDFLRYGRLRGRLGNIETRVATVNELTLLETRGFDPQTEFFIPAARTALGRNVFPDIGVLPKGGVTPVEFVEFIRLRDLAKAAARTRAIQSAYPGVPVRFVIVTD